MFFGSICRVSGVPHIVHLTAHGWVLVGGPPTTLVALAGRRWATLDALRVDLRAQIAQATNPVGEA
jgi:hypothetical protein